MPPSASVPTQPAATKRRKGEITAGRILDAAEELFATRGYAGTSLRDVGTAVGIQIASLYNHFESKDALYSAVLERNLQPVVEALGAYVRPADGGQETPRALAERMMRVAAEHKTLANLIQHETLTGGAHLTPILSSWVAPIFARSDELVDAGLAQSRWDRDELRLLVLSIYHTMVGFFTIAPLYQAVRGEDLLRDEMLEKQIRVLGDVVEMIFGDPPRG